MTDKTPTTSVAKPRQVTYAEYAIWATIIGHAIVALIDRRMGAISGGGFIISMLFYGALCLFPYLIAHRNRFGRIVYAVFTTGSLLLWLGGMGSGMSDIARGTAYLMIPLAMLSLYWLFSPAANHWFRIHWIAIDRRQLPRGDASLATNEGGAQR